MRKKLAIMPKLNDCSGDLSKKWFIYYSYLNHETGKMKRFKDYATLGKAKNAPDRYALAQTKIEDLKQKLHSGWNPFLDNGDVLFEDELIRVDQVQLGTKMAQMQTFSYYSSMFLAEKKKELNRTSIITYKSKLRRFEEWMRAKNISTLVSNISPPVIMEFFTFLIDDKKLSRESIKNYKQLLTLVFDRAVEDDKIKTNPVDPSIKGGHRIDYGAQPIAEDDLRKLMKALRNDPQLHLASLLEFYCFMRPGKEVRLMRVSWINFGMSTIKVPAEMSKNKKSKHLTIPEPLMKELRALDIHLADRDHYVLGKGGKPGEESWGKNHFSMKFARLRDKLKLPKGYKFYSFKHTGNGIAEAAGIPLSAIMQQNGHSTLDITSRYLRKSAKIADRDIRTKFPSYE